MKNKFIIMLSVMIAIMFVAIPIGKAEGYYYVNDFQDYYTKSKRQLAPVENSIKGGFVSGNQIIIGSVDSNGRLEVNFRDMNGVLDLTRQAVAMSYYTVDSMDCIAKDDNSQCMGITTVSYHATNQFCMNCWDSVGNINVMGGVVPMPLTNVSNCIFYYNSNIYVIFKCGLFEFLANGQMLPKIMTLTHLPTVYAISDMGSYDSSVWLFSDYPAGADNINVDVYNDGEHYVGNYHTNIPCTYDLSDAETFNNSNILLSFKTNPEIYNVNFTDEGGLTDYLWADLKDYGVVSINQMKKAGNLLFVSGNDINNNVLFVAMYEDSEGNGRVLAFDNEYTDSGTNSTKLQGYTLNYLSGRIFALCNEYNVPQGKINNNQIDLPTPINEHSIYTDGITWHENETIPPPDDNETPVPQTELPPMERIHQLFVNPMGDIGLLVFMFFILPIILGLVVFILIIILKNKKNKKQKKRYKYE